MSTQIRDEFFEGYEKARKEDKIIDYYNDHADTYNEALGQAGYTNTIHYCTSLLHEYLTADKGEDKVEELEILDLGCGSGLTGVALKKTGFKVVDGVDPADNMLQLAREKAVYRNVSNGIITETEKLSCYKDESYDGLLCSGCFTVGHIKFNNGMPEILRLLKKGGIAVYTISSSMDQRATLNEHMPFFLTKQCDMIRIERKFYYSLSDKRNHCHVYVIQKM